MTTIAQPVNTRPYMIIYHDCFDSDIFDNQSQRTVYMTLKKFMDSNNQCFPGVKKIAKVARLSKRAVQKALKALKKKFLINIEERFRSDGSQTSNLYTIYDTPGLWTANNVENIGNIKNTENAKNTDNSDNAKNIKNTNDVNNIENANNNDNKTETAKITVEQFRAFMSMMETEGYVLIKKDDIPAELRDKFALNSVSETISDNTIMAQNELAEENNITEMEETAEAMPGDIVVQGKEPVSNNTTMPEKGNSTIGSKIVSKLKNITRKEKAPTSVPTKVSDVSTNKNSSSSNDDTTPAPESQVSERYTMEEIRKRYDYYIYMLHNPVLRDDIDTVFNVLYDALNTTKETLRVNREDKPAMVVISRLLKLDMETILYVIEQYRKQTCRIKNVKGYLLSMLYNAKEQCHLDIQNQVSYDMDQWYEKMAQEKMDELK